MHPYIIWLLCSTDYCHTTHVCLHHQVSQRFNLANAGDALCQSSSCAARLQCVLCECGVCVDLKEVSEGPEVLKVNGWSPVAQRLQVNNHRSTHTHTQKWIKVAGDSEGEKHISYSMKSERMKLKGEMTGRDGLRQVFLWFFGIPGGVKK